MFLMSQKAKAKHYYSLIIRKKAQIPNATKKLQNEFHLSADHLYPFALTYEEALEPYFLAVQYKMVNRILYINENFTRSD